MVCIVLAVVENLPDATDVPQFTADDVVRTKEAVLKFIVAVVADLKSVMLTEIALFKSSQVDQLYG
jgi:hypothetical protein